MAKLLAMKPWIHKKFERTVTEEGHVQTAPSVYFLEFHYISLLLLLMAKLLAI